MSSEASSSWVSVGGVSDPELAQRLAGRVEARRVAGEFSVDNQRYIALLNRDLVTGVNRISIRHCELLRRMCSLQQGIVRFDQVKSHRKYLGPVIVAFKKMLYRVMKPLIDPLFQQQRDFNALSLYLLADMANELGGHLGSIEPGGTNDLLLSEGGDT